MRLFKPYAHLKNVVDIDSVMLKNLGIKAVLLDVDNTIASYTSKEPIEGVSRWLKGLAETGIRVYIVSNNFKKRVGAIAAKFSLPFIHFAVKPAPFGFIRAKRALGVKSSECLVVGDQIFTDILGANLGGMKSVLVDPVEIENGLSYRVRRHFEKKIRHKY